MDLGLSEQSIEGKTAIVTGASSGIGRACSLALAAEGANVIAVARREDALRRLVEESAGLKGRIGYESGDITDSRFIARVAGRTEPVDILVHSAAVLRNEPFLESDPDHWSKVFDTNVLALLRLTQAVAAGMARRKEGHIIVISSVLAHAVYPYTLVYAASKHAVRAIHVGLRQELGPLGIRSTEIRPGLVGDTNIFADTTHPDVVESYRERPYQPIKPIDIARAVVFAAKAPTDVDVDVLEVKHIRQP